MKSIDSAKGMMGGLTDKATKPPAKPLSGKSVADGAERKGIAPCPKTLGPRTA